MSDEPLHNEPALVHAMQSGDEEAFTALYRYYCPRLFLNILGMIRDTELAEELVQELFTRVWQHRSSQGITENFTGYVYRIAVNLVHDFFRRVQRDRLLRDRWIALAGEGYEHVEQALDGQEVAVLLNEAIERLPNQQKRAYKLVKLEGQTYRRAAELMGISPLTVKEYLVAANKSLRSNLASHTNALLVLAIAAVDLLA